MLKLIASSPAQIVSHRPPNQLPGDNTLSLWPKNSITQALVGDRIRASQSKFQKYWTQPRIILLEVTAKFIIVIITIINLN